MRMLPELQSGTKFGSKLDEESRHGNHDDGAGSLFEGSPDGEG